MLDIAGLVGRGLLDREATLCEQQIEQEIGGPFVAVLEAVIFRNRLDERGRLAVSSPVVIIAGCIDGLIPAEPDQGTPAERAAAMEEQRRLFYVGLTRVKADPASNRPGTLIFRLLGISPR